MSAVSHRSRRPRRIALAIALSLTLPAALPAVSPAAKLGLRLEAAPDKAAPAGKTPKVVLTLYGAIRNREYRIDAPQVSGQNADDALGNPVICATNVGRYHHFKARSSKLVFGPAPLTSYELSFGSPCTGTYKGKVLMRRPGNVPKTVMTFTLEVPAMRLTHVSVPRF